MSLNKYMHPRNLYKNNKPDFKKYALEHDGFRSVATQGIDGSVSIDFKNPNCLRELTKALLKSDFNLDIDIPLDRLIPAIPQRINYLLWMQDILNENNILDPVTGIDVGCGASCIYPLLGNKIMKWSFQTTEADSVNLQYAKQNVIKNNLQDVIAVIEADSSLINLAVERYLGSKISEKPFVDFCMCNPPFFDTDEFKSCRNERPEPDHVSTASDSEKKCLGGEVEFIRRMVDESLELKDKIKVYSSLVGKKSSLSKIKQYIREKTIQNVSTTEFCQGRTMRWGIAWTFSKELRFPKSLFQLEKSKSKAGYNYVIPSDIKCCHYDIPSLTVFVKDILCNQLKMKCITLSQDAAEYVCVVTAKQNTWSNSRRKRRLEICQQAAHPEPPTRDEPEQKIKRLNNTEERATDSESSDSDIPPLLNFSLELKFNGVQMSVVLKLLEGQSKDMLHQVLQYLKNRII